MLGLPVRREFLQLSFSLFLLLGLFLTFRGYRSREGDQAYRLPILLHHLDRTVLAGDTFVGYFDTFNPHRGSMALLDLARRPLGLSIGIMALFLATFFSTGIGIALLARTIWPDAPPVLGIVAAALVYFADAHGDSATHPAESGFTLFGNVRASVEGEHSVCLGHLAELIFGGRHGEQRVDDGVDDIAQQARGFEAGVAGDHQDGLGDGGDHGEGQPVG